jgi:hypothetical protein
VFDLLEFENILQSYPDADLAVGSFGPIVPANDVSPSPSVAAVPESKPAPERSETVLSDEDLVREIARQHPGYGLMRIQKELRRPERGGREINPVQLYVLLRKLELDTRERREAYAKTPNGAPTRFRSRARLIWLARS